MQNDDLLYSDIPDELGEYLMVLISIDKERGEIKNIHETPIFKILIDTNPLFITEHYLEDIGSLYNNRYILNIITKLWIKLGDILRDRGLTIKQYKEDLVKELADLSTSDSKFKKHLTLNLNEVKSTFDSSAIIFLFSVLSKSTSLNMNAADIFKGVRSNQKNK